ncbi:hypothetical protein OG511_42190 [Streptomyces sp. NBC_01453]|uniref:hypothetical protein n=1 Tax=Streptomyces sp. NBC_01453 TaxID=2903873 RepID=UPI002E2ACF46|nr:hypothetical protein [Streptomyces sp. NBC_01453]
MVTLTGREADGSVRSAASLVLPSGVHSAPLRIQGTSALLFYCFDEREHARRRSAGAGSLPQIDVLEALLELPANEPVALDGLGPAQRRTLEQALPGAVDLSGSAVIRRAVRPLSIELAVVRARATDWRRGLALAGRFASFCARALLLDGPGPDVQETLMQASFYGIGILLPSSDGLQMAVLPEPYRPQRHTAAAWRFAEEVYQRVT